MKTAELQRVAAGREAEIFAWEDGRVLRLFRNPQAGEAVRREAAAMAAVRELLPLVPAVGEIVEIDGRPGLILERIDGPDLLSRIARRPWTVWDVGRMTGRVHAELNRVPGPPSLPALKERIERKIRSSPTVPPDIAAWTLSTLPALPGGDRLLHGDLHPANIILSDAGPVVIDWPNAVRGDPTADVARTLVMGRASPLPPGTPPALRATGKLGRRLLLRAYLRAYRQIRPIDKTLLARWLVVRAAERLVEEIPDERDWLIAFVRASIAEPNDP